jgi:hypothetical protein
MTDGRMMQSGRFYRAQANWWESSQFKSHHILGENKVSTIYDAVTILTQSFKVFLLMTIGVVSFIQRIISLNYYQ